MAVTSPDNIWTPDAGDQYALTTDLAATADTVQDALTALRTIVNGLSQSKTQNLGVSRSTSTQGGITTTNVTVPGVSLSVNVTSVSNIEFTAQVTTYSSSVGDVISIALRDGTTVVAEWIRPANSSATAPGTSHTHILSTILSGVTVGSHTYNLQVKVLAGAGTATIGAGTTYPNRLSAARVS